MFRVRVRVRVGIRVRVRVNVVTVGLGLGDPRTAVVPRGVYCNMVQCVEYPFKDVMLEDIIKATVLHGSLSHRHTL